MSTRVYIRLPEDSWSDILAGDTTLEQNAGTVTIDVLRDCNGQRYWSSEDSDALIANDDLEFVLLYPGEHLLNTLVTVPRGASRYLDKTAPFLIEDKLASNVGDMHFAYLNVPDSDLYYVDCVDRSIFSRVLLWLERKLNVRRSQLTAVVPDYYFYLANLPIENLISVSSANQSSDTKMGYVLLTDHLAWAFVPNQGYFCFDACNLPSYVESVFLGTSGGTSATEESPIDADLNVVLYVPETLGTESAIESLKESYGTKISAVPYTDLDTLLYSGDALASDISSPSFNNLLQGDFEQDKDRSIADRIRAPLISLIASAAIFCVVAVAMGLYYKLEANQVHDETRALYKSFFPNDRRIINMRTQTLNHIDGSNTQGDQVFLEMLTKVSDVWVKNGRALTLKYLRYVADNRSFILDVETSSILSVENIKKALDQEGMSVQSQSINTQGQRVTARLVVQQGRG